MEEMEENNVIFCYSSICFLLMSTAGACQTARRSQRARSVYSHCGSKKTFILLMCTSERTRTRDQACVCVCVCPFLEHTLSHLNLTLT